MKGISQVEPPLGQTRLHYERALIVTLALGDLATGEGDRTAVGQKCRVLRSEHDRSINQRQPRECFPTLIFRHTEIVQGARILRIRSENLGIQTLRLLRSTRLLQQLRLGDTILHIRAQ
jgi:hypothetical protein